jgi:hypothetical protein
MQKARPCAFWKGIQVRCGVSFSLSGQVLASEPMSRTVWLWHVDGTLLHVPGHENRVGSVPFLQMGKH